MWIAGCADVPGGNASPSTAPNFRFLTQTADITMLFDPWYTAPQLRQAAAALARNSLPSSTQAGYLLTDDDGDEGAPAPFYGAKAPPPAAVPNLPRSPVSPTDPTGPVARQYAQRLHAWKTHLTGLETRWHEQNVATTRSWERSQAVFLSGVATRWSDHGPEDMCCEDWLVARGIQHAALSYESSSSSDPGTISKHIRICIVFANLGQLTPSGNLPGGLLAGVHVLAVNYDGPTGPDAWRHYFAGAGAKDTTVVPAPLTDAVLPGDVTGLLGTPA
jgi:hypothetical protein